MFRTKKTGQVNYVVSFKIYTLLLAVVLFAVTANFGCATMNQPKQQRMYDDTYLWSDEPTGTEAWVLKIDRSSSLNPLFILGEVLGALPLKVLSLYLYMHDQTHIRLWGTFVFSDWYFLNRAYTEGQQLAFGEVSRRVGGSGCGDLSEVEVCVTERVWFDIPIELAIQESCNDGLRIRVSGDSSTEFTLSKETLQGFLHKAHATGATISEPCFDLLD